MTTETNFETDFDNKAAIERTSVSVESAGDNQPVAVRNMTTRVGGVQQWSLDPKRRDIIRTALGFHYRAEWLSTAAWENNSNMPHSRNWREFRVLRDLLEMVESVPDLGALDIEEVAILRGSVHLASEAGMFKDDEREHIDDTLTWLAKHSEYRHNHTPYQYINVEHQCEEVDLTQPWYYGNFGLEQARYWRPRLEGRSFAQIEQVFVDAINGMADRVRWDFKKAHRGREDRLSLMRVAYYDMLGVIKAKAPEWRREFDEAKTSCSLKDLSHEINERMFLIDELVGMGCCGDVPGRLAAFGARFLEMIAPIDELIDWDSCPILKKHVDEARQALPRVDDPVAW
jgi:hypothetical protein